MWTEGEVLACKSSFTAWKRSLSANGAPLPRRWVIELQQTVKDMLDMLLHSALESLAWCFELQLHLLLQSYLSF